MKFLKKCTNWNFLHKMVTNLPKNSFVLGIKNIGKSPKNLDDIQGQYIGLMKFQNNGFCS